MAAWLKRNGGRWEVKFGAPVYFSIQGGSLQVRGKSTGGPFELRANTPRLALTPTGPEAESIDASLRLDGKLRGGSVRLRLTDLQPADGGLMGGKLATDLDLRMASGRLAGNLAGPIRWRAASRQLELPSLAGDLNFSPARPGTSLLKFASEADARVDRDPRAAMISVSETSNLPLIVPSAVMRISTRPFTSMKASRSSDMLIEVLSSAEGIGSSPSTVPRLRL